MFKAIMKLLGYEKISKTIDLSDVEVVEPEIIPNESDLHEEAKEMLEAGEGRLLSTFITYLTLKLYRLPKGVMRGKKLKLMVTLLTTGEVIVRTSLGDRSIIGRGKVAGHRKPSVETEWSTFVDVSKINQHFVSEEGGVDIFLRFKQFDGDTLGSMQVFQSFPKPLRYSYKPLILGEGECRTDKMAIVLGWLEDVKNGEEYTKIEY